MLDIRFSYIIFKMSKTVDWKSKARALELKVLDQDALIS